MERANGTYMREPHSPEELAGFGNHIVQYSAEYSLCAGCETCSIMCALTHDGYTGPNNCRVKVNLGTRSMIHEVLSCLQCSNHPCYGACPKKDKAMCIDQATGVVYIVKEECIGCGACARACNFEPSRIRIQKEKDRKEWYAVKCDLCRGNPDGPQCIAWCPERCLGLSENASWTKWGFVPKGQEAATAAHAAEAAGAPAKGKGAQE